MRARLPRLSLAAVAAVALSSGIVAPAASVGASGVLLRYHFVPGQSYAYRMTVTTAMKTSVAGLASGATATSAVQGIVRYHVLSVDPSGGAMVQVSTTGVTMRVTVGGQTTSRPVAATPTRTVYMAPSGRLRGNVSTSVGNFSMGSTAVLPVGPVAPGARWTYTASNNLSSLAGLHLPPVQVTAQNVYTGNVPVHAEQVAVIATTGQVQFISDSALRGVPMHMHMKATMDGHSQFGLASRRMISQHVHMDTRMYLTSRGTTGGGSMNMHMVTDTALVPYGW